MINKLVDKIVKTNAPVVVGLDPMMKYIPEHVQKEAFEQYGETLEGAGCWSPLFPARMDDLLLAASSTIKFLEEMAEKCEPETRLVTFEQIIGDGFLGLKRSDTAGSIECN